MAEPSVAAGIKYHLKTLGIDLDRHIKKDVGNDGILASWESTPAGFKFACLSFNDFVLELISNHAFASDVGIGQRFQAGASFREVSRTTSTHIIVFRSVNVKEANGRISYANVHTDTVSSVAGRDPLSKAAIYDPNTVVQHVLKDLLHTHLMAGPSETGLQLGIRF
jgi:hypothetical protein